MHFLNRDAKPSPENPPWIHSQIPMGKCNVAINLPWCLGILQRFESYCFTYNRCKSTGMIHRIIRLKTTRFSRRGNITSFIIELGIGNKILATLLGRGLEMEAVWNPVAHLQRTKGVCVTKCSYLEIGYPQPCDFHEKYHEGYREDEIEEKVRIVSDLPTKGGDLRLF